MFKLVVLSALVAVAVAKPQVHQSAIAYSAPNGGHSSTFVANGAPSGSALSSSLSSAISHNGDFLSNSAHAIASPAGYAAPGYRAYTPSAPLVSAFASSQAVRFSTPATFVARDFQNNRNTQNFRQYQENNGQRFH